MDPGFWLAHQPLWLSGLIVIGGGVLVSALGVYLIYRVYTDTELAQNVSVGGAKFQFLSQIYAVFLGLLLVALYQQYFQDQRQVQQEAATLRSIGDTAELLGPADRARLQDAVRAYALSVAEEEWPRLDRDLVSPATDARFRAIGRAIRAIEATDQRQQIALQSLLAADADLKNSRNIRTGGTPRALNRLIWFLLLLSTAVSISFFWFFGHADIASRLLFSTLLTAVIMAEVLAILVLTYPYTGDIGILPDPFLRLALPDPDAMPL